jgi:hypothetical protein
MTERASFELKRFSWAAPDRLDLVGIFSGLDDEPTGEPSLVVRGADGAHRLPAVMDSISGSPAEHDQWAATFAWLDAPVAFDEAQLEFDSGLCVELPPPGGRRALRRQIFDVRTADAHPSAEPGPEPGEATAAPASVLADRPRLPEALVTAEQEARQTLERLRIAAEEAVSAEKSAVAQLGDDLRDAHEALDEAALVRHELESELASLRERLSGLERASTDLEELRVALEQSRQDASELRSALHDSEAQLQSARADHAKADRALGEARAGVERLLEQLKGPPAS